MKNKNRIAKLGKIEWFFQTFVIILTVMFQEITMDFIRKNVPAALNEPFMKGTLFNIILFVILYTIIYCFSYFVLSLISNSDWFRKMCLKEECIDGIWVECITDTKDVKKIRSLGKTHIDMNINGISYSGDNYRSDFTHEGHFEAVNTSYKVKDKSIDLLYINSTVWDTKDETEESHGILNFKMEQDERTKVKAPIYHTGTFYKKLNDESYCAMKFFAKKVEDKADLKILLYNDPTSEPFKRTFNKYLKKIKSKYGVGESNE